jgi:hypothetical protein
MDRYIKHNGIIYNLSGATFRVMINYLERVTTNAILGNNPATYDITYINRQQAGEVVLKSYATQNAADTGMTALVAALNGATKVIDISTTL